jgi:integrase/recombinase XerD
VVAAVLGRVRAELPVIGGLGERDQVLVAAWLTGLRSARTRRAYAGDVAVWLGWLAGRDTGVLAAGRVQVDLWAATWLDGGAAASSVRRRLSALSSFYRYCAAHDVIGQVPTAGVARPAVDPDYTATVGLDRDQARALVAAADADTGARALRTAAVVRLLLHNVLRVVEACAASQWYSEPVQSCAETGSNRLSAEGRRRHDTRLPDRVAVVPSRKFYRILRSKHR